MTDRKPIFALYAERYAAKGLAIFPLAPNSKKPLKGSHGFKDATADHAQIEAWSRETPFSNIGLATGAVSGVSLIDLDPKNYGFDTERAFRAEGKLWPDTPIVRTRSGGRHIWLAYHAALITGANRLGPGIDIRNDGGFAVLPPSVIDGRKYQWLGWPLTGLAPVPQWVLDFLEADRLKREAKIADLAEKTVKIDAAKCSDLEQRRYRGLAPSKLRFYKAELEKAREPGRGTALYTVTGRMSPFVRHGFIEETAVRAAFEAASHTNGLVKKNWHHRHSPHHDARLCRGERRAARPQPITG